MSRGNLDKMLSASAVHKSESAAEHSLAVANLDTLFSQAVTGWVKADRDADTNISGIRRMFAPMNVGGKARLVKLTVKEFAGDQGNRIYSVEAISVENEISPVPEMVDADRANGSRLLTGPTGLASSLVQRLQDFNRNGASKAVDENGEPLVVYHSTNAAQWGAQDLGFSEFLTKTSEMGAHFGSAAQANSFGSSTGRRLMPVYLAIDNPLRLVDHGDFDVPNVAWQLASKKIISEQMAYEFAGDPWYEREKSIAELQKIMQVAGYDGIVYLNRREGAADGEVAEAEVLGEMTDEEIRSEYPTASDSWIAFDPTQIKSATGNNGQFDPNNPDIRFSRASATPQPTTWALEAKTGDALIQKYQDGRVDLKRAQQAIEAFTGREIPETADARLAETLYAGRVADRVKAFMLHEAKPLLDLMAKYGVTDRSFNHMRPSITPGKRPRSA